MNGLHRLARLICEIHACPPASAEIRQNVPAKLSTLLSGGTEFVCMYGVSKHSRNIL